METSPASPALASVSAPAPAPAPSLFSSFLFYPMYSQGDAGNVSPQELSSEVTIDETIEEVDSHKEKKDEQDMYQEKDKEAIDKEKVENQTAQDLATSSSSDPSLLSSFLFYPLSLFSPSPSPSPSSLINAREENVGEKVERIEDLDKEFVFVDEDDKPSVGKEDHPKEDDPEKVQYHDFIPSVEREEGGKEIETNEKMEENTSEIADDSCTSSASSASQSTSSFYYPFSSLLSFMSPSPSPYSASLSDAPSPYEVIVPSPSKSDPSLEDDEEWYVIKVN